MSGVSGTARGEVSLKKELRTRSQYVLQHLSVLRDHVIVNNEDIYQISQKWFQISRKYVIGTHKISETEAYTKDANNIKILIQQSKLTIGIWG